MLRCVINHLRLTKTVHGLELLQATETDGEEYRHLCGVMKDVFSRLNGLIRQLQSMADMEQKWAHELDDVREGILQPSAAFFNDFHLQEVRSVLVDGFNCCFCPISAILRLLKGKEKAKYGETYSYNNPDWKTGATAT